MKVGRWDLSMPTLLRDYHIFGKYWDMLNIVNKTQWESYKKKKKMQWEITKLFKYIEKSISVTISFLHAFTIYCSTIFFKILLISLGNWIWCQIGVTAKVVY